jgi:peptidoglycan/LPS O-acetylase OafA/YrhL
VAVLLSRWRKSLELFYEKNFRQIALGGVGLIFAPAALRILHLPERLQVAGFDSMQGIGFGLLLVQSILFPNSGLYRFLNWKCVKHIGVLSYSIYIWQQMFCGTDEMVFGVKGAWWVGFPLWILSALLVAHASYYLLERPLLGLRARFRAK